jgi:phospholipase C
MRKATWAAVLCGFLGGQRCGHPGLTNAPEPDASAPDSGSASEAPDAGSGTDAAPPHDAGHSDASREDSGSIGDAGPLITDAGAADAAVSPDGGGDAGPVFSTPIRHVIVIIKENHTFDNYFGTFPGAEGTTTCVHADGGTFTCPHAPDMMPRDLNHDHWSGLTDWAHGAMNGYDLVPNTSVNGDNLAYAQYWQSDIPNYWAYAQNFTLGDHFFAGMIGESFPGHLIVLAAQAAWSLGDPNMSYLFPYWGCDQGSGYTLPVQDQPTCTVIQQPPCFLMKSVPDVLPNGVTWKFYGSNFYLLPEIWSMFDAVNSVRNGPGWANVVNYTEFDSDVANGTLPSVSWLVDQDLADEHPQIGSICVGENWTVQKINEIMQSPYWADTAIIFTMDDFGGWYDHVPPPTQYGCDAQNPYGLGFRLPLLIISPYAKPGFVFKEVAEHASIPRFIEAVMGSQNSLSDFDPAARDGQANDLMNAFDFTQAPLPPLVLQQRICL